MYQLRRINNDYNYDERVIITEMFISDSENVDDLFSKKVASDKSSAEMKALTSNWSLTTLSLYTGKTASELCKKIGKSFKRCFVRPLSTSVVFDTSNMCISHTSGIAVSLNSGFDSPCFFTTYNETPLTDEFLKNLQNPSKVGYFPVNK